MPVEVKRIGIAVMPGADVQATDAGLMQSSRHVNLFFTTSHSEDESTWLDPLARAARLDTRAWARLLSGLGPPLEQLDDDLSVTTGQPSPTPNMSAPINGVDPHFREPGIKQRHLHLDTIGLIDRCDLAVIGGGPCGLPAGISAAEQGLQVICTESHGAFGGANTVGGVSKYWFGHWNRAFKSYYLQIKALSATGRLPSSLAFLRRADHPKLTLLPRMPACGVASENRSVQGVCLITHHGFALLQSERFVDATGDGDVAAWAGNPYTWGSERDEITMWYSFGRFHHGKHEASRNYHSVVDPRSMADFSRAAIAGRRQAGIFGDAEYPQHYMAVRETRHIQGRARLTYLDILMNRHFPDTVLVCQSNLDIKGMASSDAAMCGLTERSFLRNYTCSIPYRAFLPSALDNLLAAGKAYSLSHDAMSMARMQPDMMTLGLAVGHMAALAQSQQRNWRDLDVAALQARLIDAGALTRADVEQTFERTRPCGEELKILADRAAMGPLELADQARLANASEPAGDILDEAMTRASNPLTLARLLCLYRDMRGADVIADRIETILNEHDPQLQPLDQWLPRLPDHGWAPECVQLLNALAMVRDERLPAFFDRLVPRLKLDMAVNDWQFYYVHAVSYAGERLACDRMIPSLRHLLEMPAITDAPLGPRDPLMATSDFIRERYAYLHMCLGRALARCGERAGYERLIMLLTEPRLYLARSALAELCALSGVDHGFCSRSWRSWLDEQSDASLAPSPFTQALD